MTEIEYLEENLTSAQTYCDQLRSQLHLAHKRQQFVDENRPAGIPAGWSCYTTHDNGKFEILGWYKDVVEGEMNWNYVYGRFSRNVGELVPDAVCINRTTRNLCEGN